MAGRGVRKTNKGINGKILRSRCAFMKAIESALTFEYVTWSNDFLFLRKKPICFTHNI